MVPPVSVDGDQSTCTDVGDMAMAVTLPGVEGLAELPEGV